MGIDQLFDTHFKTDPRIDSKRASPPIDGDEGNGITTLPLTGIGSVQEDGAGTTDDQVSVWAL